MGKPKLQVVQPPEDRAAIFDEYYELCAKADEFKLIENRRKFLADKIQSWYEKERAEQHYIAVGYKYDILVSAKQNVRTVISYSKIFGMLGKHRFLELASIPLGVLDKWLTPDAQIEVISQAQTGRRSLTPVLKVAAIEEPKAA